MIRNSRKKFFYENSSQLTVWKYGMKRDTIFYYITISILPDGIKYINHIHMNKNVWCFSIVTTILFNCQLMESSNLTFVNEHSSLQQIILKRILFFLVKMRKKFIHFYYETRSFIHSVGYSRKYVVFGSEFI